MNATMHRPLAVAAWALLLAAGAAPAAPATGTAHGLHCTCMSPKRPPCEVWWQTSAIFIGRVTRIRTVHEDTSEGRRVSRLVTLRVAERFQGVSGQRDVDVATGAGGGDCGFDFEQGETYLVYANESVATGRLETGICSRTAPVAEARQDLDYLRALDTADKVVSLYGMVYRDAERPEPGEPWRDDLDPGGPLPDVEIELVRLDADGGPAPRTARSDAEGWYEFHRLQPGRYEIRLHGPGIPEEDRWRFRIPVAPACIWRNIIVEPASVRGKRTKKSG